MLEDLGLALGLGEAGVLFHFTLFIGLFEGDSMFLIFSLQLILPLMNLALLYTVRWAHWGGLACF